MWPWKLKQVLYFMLLVSVSREGNGDTEPRVQCHSTCFLEFICWEDFVLAKKKQTKNAGSKTEMSIHIVLCEAYW